MRERREAERSNLDSTPRNQSRFDRQLARSHILTFGPSKQFLVLLLMSPEHAVLTKEKYAKKNE